MQDLRRRYGVYVLGRSFRQQPERRDQGLHQPVLSTEGLDLLQRACRVQREFAGRQAAEALHVGAGAHVESLRRLAAGEFTLDAARTLEQVEALCREDRLVEALIPPLRLLPEAPAQHVAAVTAAQILHG